MSIEEFIWELRIEIDNVNFKSFNETDISFNWINNLLDDIDNIQSQRELRQILNDTEKYPLLQDSYFAMLDYLFKRS